VLKKENRANKSDFHESKKETRQTFKSFHSPFFTLRLKPINKDKNSKIAFIAGKTSFKLSTERNKIKRMARESVRKIIPSIKKGFFISLFINKEAAGKKYKEFSEEVRSMFNQAKLTK